MTKSCPNYFQWTINAAFVIIILFYELGDSGSPNNSTSMSHQAANTADIVYQSTSHKVNRFRLGVTNLGNFGGGLLPVIDVFTGEESWIGSEFPRESQISHFSAGGVMVGAIVKGDTLVSSYGPSFIIELNPDESPFGALKYRSTRSISQKVRDGAVSEEDFIAAYTDTFSSFQLPQVGFDYFGNRPHKPLNIKITEESYAWTQQYAEDFVIFNFSIENIGNDNLKQLYFGIWISPQVGWVQRDDIDISDDDISGFISTYSLGNGCPFLDTLNLAWWADNDGDPYQGQFIDRPPPYSSAKSAAGIAIIGLPIENAGYSFNWFNQLYPTLPSYFDFGPRHKNPFRNFHTGGLGWPFGDVNLYHMLSNKEIDYDMFLTSSIGAFDQNWLYPDGRIGLDQSDGKWHVCMLSVGPFDLAEGNILQIIVALAAGENFHTKLNNLANLYSGNYNQYYSNLDFTDLVKNIDIAKWIYDNPGVDTDNDGYRGEFHICVLDSVLDADSNWIVSEAETTWHKGDGVPDWKPALPPPAPKMWVTPMYKGIHIRFNGEASENVRDIFTQLNDFEGFNVYVGRDEREQSFSLVASYDIENYDKYVWNYDKQPDPGWDLLEFPMTPEQIQCNYASSCDDSTFDPLSYRIGSPYVHPNYPESLLYWEKHQWNVDEFGVATDIKKIYPNARDPKTIPPDSLTANDYTDDGYLKFYDYEITLENLLPTVGYYVSVTAFDFGWPKSRLEPLESSITDNAQLVYASLVDSALGEDYNKVIVYPNPYKLDDHYRQRGFEGVANDTRSNERVRRIHFANLPHKCTIKIFSLDGDLVREIHHDTDPNDPAGSHVEWGLVSKNGLAVVSGLYYWVVESFDGTVQMGKLAIIL